MSKENLLLYQWKVEELKRTRLLRSGINPGISFNFERMKGLSFAAHEPDEEDLRSFLMIFRQFFSENEPIFINKIYNFCFVNIRSEELKGSLINARQLWKKAVKGFGIKFLHNGKEITPEFIYDKWINGHYFHCDREKIALLNQMAPLKPLTRYLFLEFILEGTRQILFISDIVTIALKDHLISLE